MSQKNCNCIACTENWPAVLAPNVNNINGKNICYFCYDYIESRSAGALRRQVMCPRM